MNLSKALRFSTVREIAFSSIVLFILCAAVIWVRTLTVKETYVYVRLEKEARQLEQDVQAVRMQWLKQTSPKRLDALAESLGLKAPELQQVLKYGSSSKN